MYQASSKAGSKLPLAGQMSSCASKTDNDELMAVAQDLP